MYVVTTGVTIDRQTVHVWKGDGAGVCDGAAAEIRVVSVTSLLAWAVTISAIFRVGPPVRVT